ncbi:MAG: hypothetical protein O3C21_01975 [Verrucomicrobia bacterium]|nr:hypothetical protein [Verrucomicrobiota bacterium]
MSASRHRIHGACNPGTGSFLHYGREQERWEPRRVTPRFRFRRQRDKTVRLWDPETGREIHRFDLPSSPQSVEFNPAGTLLAAALVNGTSILLKVPRGL